MKKQANILLVVFFLMELLYNIGYVTSQDKETYDTDRQLLQLEDLYDKGNYQKTYDEAKRIAEIDRQNPKVWLYMGLSAYKINLHKESLESLKKALDIDPNQFDAYKDLAEVYLNNGVWGKAHVYYEKAAELNPNDDISRNLRDLCEKASNEQRDMGFVSAETLKQIQHTNSQDNYRAIDISNMRIPLSIGFRRGKYRISDLSNAGLEQLKAVSDVLKGSDWLGKGIVVESHACSCGSRQSNLALSQRRGKTILNYLIDQGIAKTENAYVIPYGEDRPLENSPDENLPPAQCENNEIHLMNRRTIIREYITGESISQSANNKPKQEAPKLEAKTPSLDVSFWYRHRTDGKFQILTDGAILHSKDEIKVSFMSPKKIYAYIFYHKSNGDLLCLCPSKTLTNPVEPNKKYWFPSSTRGAILDDTAGTEEIVVYLGENLDIQKEEWARTGILSNKPKNSRIEKETVMNTRGVDGTITIEEPKDLYLPTNWYKYVKFQNEP